VDKKTSSLPPALIQLEDLVGDFMQYWGFKKIHGRIWTHLYTSQKPLDTAELMERLSVSKGLMSLAIRDLLDYDVIKTDHVGRHGTAFFIANPDLFSVISNVLRIRENKMLSQTLKTCETLKSLKQQDLEKAELDYNRIQSVLELTESAQTLLQTFLIESPNLSEEVDFKKIVYSQN
jgi:DNA-binding transcriptional regulator GbsR (MarR family)